MLSRTSCWESISGHPDVNSETSALWKAMPAALVSGVGASPKKYSILSVKSVKLPTGVTRPTTFLAKIPGGTSLSPLSTIALL
ncbi:hypothetical protein E6O75_ATG11299 [Venturia nashicola]|uniref:Uncharacterized protein n=1 Tax=Venturia nashicola TaxID=86259 RepID=A0A4Z1P1B6_9PEZI|nr:hypothetical protein E6O75_ATG11299 [Venturia nashicola]